MKEFNANEYREMFIRMGIDIDKLGCIMLDLDNENDKAIRPFPKEWGDDILFSSSRPERFWIKGFVAGHTPHVTLLYGLIYPICNQLDVDTVLKGWTPEDVEIRSVGFFESPYADEPYYCIVAHVKITDNLIEAHRRLELLPHINTFPDYKAHLTIAYIKKDDELRDKVIAAYTQALADNVIKVKQINYGKNFNSLINFPFSSSKQST